jgi:antitoxin component HigA of HigAB toxin-antitoxin module
MELKPIRTEEDYEEALAKIDELWEAEPGSPEGDLLDVLTTLAEAYEEKRHPIFPLTQLKDICLPKSLDLISSKNLIEKSVSV